MSSLNRTAYNDSLAQLGERYLDRVEVAGSNPVGIILLEKPPFLLKERMEAFFCFFSTLLLKVFAHIPDK